MEFFNTFVTDQAKQLVQATLDSGFLSEGKRVREFELALEQQLGLRNAVCVNSGTSALHLALIAAGVKQGDEVITSPQTFIATALAILYCGATPVFADINPYTGNVTAETIYQKITRKTRAVISVHWAGYPNDISDISSVAQMRGVWHIEDAAHAFGATYGGLPVGGLPVSHAVCFSFQAIKHVTTGDGGAVCFPKILKKQDLVRRLRWFGISKENDLPDELGERVYTLNDVGYKYNMNDVAASIGLGNLVGFHERLARRRSIAKLYFTELANVAGLELMHYETDRESSYWLFPLLVEKRLDFVRMMKDNGIPTSVVHQRTDKHVIFGGVNEDLAGMSYFDSHQIHIPIHDGLNDDEIDLIINKIQEGW